MTTTTKTSIKAEVTKAIATVSAPIDRTKYGSFGKGQHNSQNFTIAGVEITIIAYAGARMVFGKHIISISARRADGSALGMCACAGNSKTMASWITNAIESSLKAPAQPQPVAALLDAPTPDEPDYSLDDEPTAYEDAMSHKTGASVEQLRKEQAAAQSVDSRPTDLQLCILEQLRIGGPYRNIADVLTAISQKTQEFGSIPAPEFREAFEALVITHQVTLDDDFRWVAADADPLTPAPAPSAPPVAPSAPEQAYEIINSDYPMAVHVVGCRDLARLPKHTDRGWIVRGTDVDSVIEREAAELSSQFDRVYTKDELFRVYPCCRK
jgi:hypothetical protein